MGVLAVDYPLLNVFWTILWFAVLAAWIMTVFRVVADVFRRDMRGGAKGLWLLAILAFPFLGVVAYLVANGESMAQRSLDEARAAEDAFRAYIRSAAGTDAATGPADQLAKLVDLRDRGAISETEFLQGKARVLT